VKLGIYGGTFDPIHVGHLILAEQTREILALDRVLFVPAANPPHKIASQISPAELRYQMLQLSIQANPVFESSRIEIDRAGLSYTIDTIQEIKVQLRLVKTQIFLFIGADSLVEIHNWYQPERIFEECQVIVFPRPGIDLTNSRPVFRQQALCLNTPLFDISSSQIRALVKAGQSIRYLVTEPVRQFIVTQKLYHD
jgi:nicotinate-nucleotide adenylyltransferase